MKEQKNINPLYEAFYIQSMKFNTASAINSLDILEEEFKKIPTKHTPEHMHELDWSLILNNLQNIIIQAGVISKYFWPIRNSHKWRGIQLRKSFDIKDNNPLKSRDLRDAIEHFDERLDCYLENSIHGIFLPEYIGSNLEHSNIPTHRFRAYYIDNMVFQLLDKYYEINPIIKEILKIHDKLTECMENGNLPKNST